MKYINQKMYVEKYETNQIPINEELVDYIQDELLSDNDIDVNLIDINLIEYLYDKNKDTKSQLNNEQLLLIESGKIEWYPIRDVIDEYILNNGIEVGWSRLHNYEIMEEWITED